MAAPPPKTEVPPPPKIVGFMFDLIVVRVDCPKENFENPKNLSVDLNFKNVDLQITSSRINVVEFRAGRSYEFEEKIEALRDYLRKNNLKFTVKYCDKAVGKCPLITLYMYSTLLLTLPTRQKFFRYRERRGRLARQFHRQSH